MTDENKGEQCQRCGEVDQDRRTLWMACFYEMTELGLPFLVREIHMNTDPLDKRAFYTLRVCKTCRAEWMDAIKQWFETKPALPPPVNSGIFVRRWGRNVEISEEEWNRLNPGREPVRVNAHGV